MSAKWSWSVMLLLLSMALVEATEHRAFGEEILVKGVPYITQKAHID